MPLRRNQDPQCPMNLRSEAGTEVRSRIRQGKKEEKRIALHDPEELLHVPNMKQICLCLCLWGLTNWAVMVLHTKRKRKKSRRIFVAVFLLSLSNCSHLCLSSAVHRPHASSKFSFSLYIDTFHENTTNALPPESHIHRAYRQFANIYLDPSPSPSWKSKT
jgi:hypothetical protein